MGLGIDMNLDTGIDRNLDSGMDMDLDLDSSMDMVMMSSSYYSLCCNYCLFLCVCNFGLYVFISFILSHIGCLVCTFFLKKKG